MWAASFTCWSLAEVSAAVWSDTGAIQRLHRCFTNAQLPVPDSLLYLVSQSQTCRRVQETAVTLAELNQYLLLCASRNRMSTASALQHNRNRPLVWRLSQNNQTKKKYNNNWGCRNCQTLTGSLTWSLKIYPDCTLGYKAIISEADRPELEHAKNIWEKKKREKYKRRVAGGHKTREQEPVSITKAGIQQQVSGTKSRTAPGPDVSPVCRLKKHCLITWQDKQGADCGGSTQGYTCAAPRTPRQMG